MCAYARLYRLETYKDVEQLKNFVDGCRDHPSWCNNGSNLLGTLASITVENGEKIGTKVVLHIESHSSLVGFSFSPNLWPTAC